MAYHGVITDINGVVLVVKTLGGKVTIPLPSVKFVIPKPVAA